MIDWVFIETFGEYLYSFEVLRQIQLFQTNEMNEIIKKENIDQNDLAKNMLPSLRLGRGGSLKGFKKIEFLDEKYCQILCK